MSENLTAAVFELRYTSQCGSLQVQLCTAGEVFVLDDGGEVDLDLGNYERFLDVTLHSDSNITTGKIYQDVITRERRGDYLGKTVQGVHVLPRNKY